jgi:hypothetical protein
MTDDWSGKRRNCAEEPLIVAERRRTISQIIDDRESIAIAPQGSRDRSARND